MINFTFKKINSLEINEVKKLYKIFFNYSCSCNYCCINNYWNKFKEKNTTSVITPTSTTMSVVKESTTTASTKKINSEFYSSSSTEIANYSFISPAGWSLVEYQNGIRALVKNISSSGSESIIVSAEKMEGLNEIKMEAK